jgi:ABC-type tungstate transport system permease subunit
MTQFIYNNKAAFTIYKGITIELTNGYYVFFINGIKNTNTNIHMAKRMITSNLKTNQ